MPDFHERQLIVVLEAHVKIRVVILEVAHLALIELNVMGLDPHRVQLVRVV